MRRRGRVRRGCPQTHAQRHRDAGQRSTHGQVRLPRLQGPAGAYGGWWVSGWISRIEKGGVAQHKMVLLPSIRLRRQRAAAMPRGQCCFAGQHTVAAESSARDYGGAASGSDSGCSGSGDSGDIVMPHLMGMLKLSRMPMPLHELASHMYMGKGRSPPCGLVSHG
eukprot:361412-Chlamydomonas_euryale.AAC.5